MRKLYLLYSFVKTILWIRHLLSHLKIAFIIYFNFWFNETISQIIWLTVVKMLQGWLSSWFFLTYSPLFHKWPSNFPIEVIYVHFKFDNSKNKILGWGNQHRSSCVAFQASMLLCVKSSTFCYEWQNAITISHFVTAVAKFLSHFLNLQPIFLIPYLNLQSLLV